MALLWLSYLIMIGGKILPVSSSPGDRIRVVTWNVADNSRMGGSFTDAAIDKVLGFDKKVGRRKPTMYAVGVQENRWKCNKGNIAALGQRFLARINSKVKSGEPRYEVVTIQATRNTTFCEVTSFVTHGTTALVVIATKSFVTSYTGFRHNKGCHGNLFKNKEKGVAAVKTVLKSGEMVCFATAHLDSGSASVRRQCMRNFFSKANTQFDWSSCDFQFFFGDLNTRTGKNKSGSNSGEKAIHVPKTKDFKDLKNKDELTGKTPYGTDSEWRGNLLDYINVLENINCKDKQDGSSKCYKECPRKFMPTFKIEPSKKTCKFPCYRADRPLSWTDRVLYKSGACVVYDAVYGEFGDHFPVFAEFLLRK